MTKVTLFHNISTDGYGRNPGFMGYVHGHALTPVAQYDTAQLRDDIPEQAFHIFNVGDDPVFGEPNPLAVAYRAARNRSLSVGDVLLVGNTWLACASSGWDVIDVPKWITFASTYGSTALDGEKYIFPAVTGH